MLRSWRRAVVLSLALGLLMGCSAQQPDAKTPGNPAAASGLTRQPHEQGHELPDRPDALADCPGVHPTFDIYTPGLRGAQTAPKAAGEWLLKGERVGHAFALTPKTQAVEIIHNHLVVRVLELARTRRGWVPEKVTACHTAVHPKTDKRPSCPSAISDSEQVFQQKVPDPGPSLGIAPPVLNVRVHHCGVLLPGNRLLVLTSDVWPVTAYAKSEQSAQEGLLISLLIDTQAGTQNRKQDYFQTEYFGTS